MNTNTLNFDYLDHYTYDELQKFMDKIENELYARDAAKRDEAISAFQRAFYDLKDLGITPTYQDDNWDEGVNLRDWDCFYF